MSAITAMPVSINSEVPEDIRTTILEGLEDDVVVNDDNLIQFSRVGEHIVLHDNHLGIWAGVFTYADEDTARAMVEQLRADVEANTESEDQN